MASLELKNSEILRAIAFVEGVNRSASEWDTTALDDARAIIRAGIRKFVHPVPFHQWQFLERKFVASGYASQSTGTISATGGVVTLSGATWPAWAADGILRVNGQIYFVDQVTDTTTLSVTDAAFAADASTTYEIHRWRYVLPTNYGEILDGCVYSNGSQSRPLELADEAEIRLRYAVNFQSGDPKRFAIYKGGENDTEHRWYFAVWPTLDVGGFTTVPYRSEPVDNLDDADLTADGSVVQIDSVHAETLLAAIMSAAEEYYNDTIDGPHSLRFEKRLAASIEHDRHSKGPVMMTVPKGVDPLRAAMFANTPIYYDGDGDVIP